MIISYLHILWIYSNSVKIKLFCTYSVLVFKLIIYIYIDF